MDLNKVCYPIEGFCYVPYDKLKILKDPSYEDCVSMFLSDPPIQAFFCKKETDENLYVLYRKNFLKIQANQPISSLFTLIATFKVSEQKAIINNIKKWDLKSGGNYRLYILNGKEIGVIYKVTQNLDLLSNIYFSQKRKIDLYKKNTDYLKVITHAQYNNKTFADFLFYKNIKKIAFYCNNISIINYDPVDSLLITETLSTKSVEMYGICFKVNKGYSYEDIPIISMDEINNSDVDAVFCSDMLNTVYLKNKCNKQVYSIEDYSNYLVAVTKANYLVVELIRLLNNGIKVMFFHLPSCLAMNYENISDWEKYLVDNNKHSGDLINDFKKSTNLFFVSEFNKQYSDINDYLNVAFKSPILPKKNYTILTDTNTIYKNITQGYRFTTDSPSQYNSVCHIFGSSVGFCSNDKDMNTSSSFLQRILNQEKFKIKVINHCIIGGNTRITANMIKDTNINKQDVVIILSLYYSTPDRDITVDVLKETLQKHNIPYYNTFKNFERPHNLGEIFANGNHLSLNGNRKVAEIIYDKVFCNYEVGNISNVDLMKNKLVQPYYDELNKNSELKEYLSYLDSLNKHCVSGAIVMNCNPFTLGHRYLIEYASHKVEHLYIFAVEEDRSVFPFDDRFQLIKDGTRDLPNVMVLRSGKFIISTLTFPEYFEKGDKQETVIDATEDIELFGRYIAPRLGITMRFAGEEPLDNVTNQYNQTMQRILPKYDIDFEVIPRKEQSGGVISASRVRKLLESKDFGSISELVPKTTLDYLIEKYNN